MANDSHSTYVYVGLGGEGENIGLGGMYRRADGDYLNEEQDLQYL